MEKLNNFSISRRDVLRSTAAASALSLVSQTASAEEPKKMSEVEFVDVGLRYDGAPEYSCMHNDGFLDYNVEERNLIFNSHIEKEVIEQFRNQKSMMKALEYASLPKIAFDFGPISNLPSRLGPDMDIGVRLKTKEERVPPQVNISNGSGGIIAQIDGRGIKIPPGEQIDITLEEITATVDKPTENFREIPDPRTGDTKKRRIYEDEKVTLSPVVTVRNHGKVSVYQV